MNVRLAVAHRADCEARLSPEQARADATEAFSMAQVTATTVWFERTSWEGGQAHRATFAQGERLNRATWVLAGSTGVLALATLGLIWATFTA